MKIVLFMFIICFIVAFCLSFPNVVLILLLIFFLFLILKKNNNKNSNEKCIDEKKMLTNLDNNIFNENSRGNNIKINKSDIKEIVDFDDYLLPPKYLLDTIVTNKYSDEYLKKQINNLEKIFEDFNVKAKVVEVHIGPFFIQFEIVIPSGVRVSKITNLKNDISLFLGKKVQIEAPIYGKKTIGINVFQEEVEKVGLKSILLNSSKKSGILISLGKDVTGIPQVIDLTEMTHLLVSGSTGSGKSTFLNVIICSILMSYKPNEVKLMLIDTRNTELSYYNKIPHLICPVISDSKKASVALQKLVSEMERRYDLFSEKNVKNIGGYNELIDKENKNSDVKQPRMHYIVAIIDELADLMLVASKEVEDSIMRITQTARVVGIHLIVATQRPSNDVITGVVKANIPSRIAFKLPSSIDSKTVLDIKGANNLKNVGDMLYFPLGEINPRLIRGCYISDKEIKRIVEYVCKQHIVQYDVTMEDLDGIGIQSFSNEKEEYDDLMYNEIVEFAIQTGKISTSLLQRRFRLGYNKAARLIDLLEKRGIVGPSIGSKPREVLIKNNKEK